MIEFITVIIGLRNNSIASQIETDEVAKLFQRPLLTHQIAPLNEENNMYVIVCQYESTELKTPIKMLYDCLETTNTYNFIVLAIKPHHSTTWVLPTLNNRKESIKGEANWLTGLIAAAENTLLQTPLYIPPLSQSYSFINLQFRTGCQDHELAEQQRKEWYLRTILYALTIGLSGKSGISYTYWWVCPNSPTDPKNSFPRYHFPHKIAEELKVYCSTNPDIHDSTKASILNILRFRNFSAEATYIDDGLRRPIKIIEVNLTDSNPNYHAPLYLY